VQKRFADVRDTNFGFTRIGVEHRAFQPRSPEEVDAVKRLGSAKTQVLFYVLRNGFEREMGSPPSYSGLKGPLYMRAGKVQERFQYETSDWQKIPDDAPTYMKIISVAKKVCVDKAAAKGINIPNGRWTISAVPIVASDKACLRCHDTAGKTHSFSSTGLPVRKVKLGDTLGVALYCSMNLE
jgi:hypothetical protein